jgi:hypothetical protein
MSQEFNEDLLKEALNFDLDDYGDDMGMDNLGMGDLDLGNLGLDDTDLGNMDDLGLGNFQLGTDTLEVQTQDLSKETTVEPVNKPEEEEQSVTKP